MWTWNSLVARLSHSVAQEGNRHFTYGPRAGVAVLRTRGLWRSRIPLLYFDTFRLLNSRDEILLRMSTVAIKIRDNVFDVLVGSDAIHNLKSFLRRSFTQQFDQSFMIR